MPDPKIIVALDFDSQEVCMNLVEKLDPNLCRLKVGKELFTSCGPDIVRRVQDIGFEVFLDLKFHDIPTTVAKACAASANLGVWMMNVHSLGGLKMMSDAKKAVQDTGKDALVIAVTLLTTHDQNDISLIGLSGEVEKNVLHLAEMSQESGLDGVVCSAQEASKLKSIAGNEFLLITPGIRPLGSHSNDQKRILTPSAAIKAGSDYLVIGRPITQAADPITMLNTISKEIEEANI